MFSDIFKDKQGCGFSRLKMVECRCGRILQAIDESPVIIMLWEFGEEIVGCNFTGIGFFACHFVVSFAVVIILLIL